VFSALNQDFRYIYKYMYMDVFSVNQCVSHVNGARMPIWQTARQSITRALKMPTEIAGVDNEDLLLLVHKLLFIRQNVRPKLQNDQPTPICSDMIPTVSYQILPRASDQMQSLISQLERTLKTLIGKGSHTCS
jgi:hypothetical protein